MGPRIGLHREVDPPAERAGRGQVRPLQRHHPLRRGEPHVLHIPRRGDQPDPIRDRLVHEVQSSPAGKLGGNPSMVLAYPPCSASGRPGLRPGAGRLQGHHRDGPHRPMAGLRLDNTHCCDRSDPRRRIPRAIQDGPDIHRNLWGHNTGLLGGARGGIRGRKGLVRMAALPHPHFHGYLACGNHRDLRHRGVPCVAFSHILSRTTIDYFPTGCDSS